MNPTLDFFFDKGKKWSDEFEQLRSIALDCGLEEVMKWGQACYTYQKANIVLIHGFKEYCAYLFFKGALLHDARQILVQQTENVQAARQVRFTNTKDIIKLKATLKSYIHEAIEVEKAGLKVTMKKTAAFSMPDEFAEVLKKKPALKKAFEALTPGRQRGYLLHFSSAKQVATRKSRVGKAIPDIMKGRGLNE